MNNYSYITFLSDDSYIFGIILLQESLERVNTQYSLEVLVTPNVSNATINVLNQLKLKYRIVDAVVNQEQLDYNKKIVPQFAKMWSLNLTKLKIFDLTEYDKVLYLDTDIMVLKNLDHLFERPHMTSALDGEYSNVWPDEPHFNSGILIIEPNHEEYEKLIDYAINFNMNDWNRPQCMADQELLNLYYSDWVDKPELHLNKYYDIFPPYILEELIEDVEKNAYFLHFVGRKPWRAFNKPAHETYTEKFYEDAHKLIQDKVNTIDWNSAKKELKLAVYSICKDEIKNVEKFIKCFNKADYLCILDTGSTDGTWEYLQKAQKEYPNLIIEQKIFNPWRYDVARNYSLTLVPKDTTMYFMADLDEIIKEDDWVEKIKNAWDPIFSRGMYVYNRQVDPKTDAVIQLFVEYRIHNNGWHYKGIVHEQLCDISDSRQFFNDECIQVPITVWHYPTNPNREVYIELCERGVEEEPLNWLMHLQLAAEYEVHQLFEKAIVEYRKIIAEQTTLSLPEIGRCYASLGRALANTNKKDEGLEVLKKGILIIPNYSDNYFLAAEICYGNNDFKLAYTLCEQGLKNCTQSFWCTIVNCNSYFPYLLMGLSQYYLNNKILGLGYLAIAKEKNNNEEISNIYYGILNELTNRR